MNIEVLVKISDNGSDKVSDIYFVDFPKGGVTFELGEVLSKNFWAIIFDLKLWSCGANVGLHLYFRFIEFELCT